MIPLFGVVQLTETATMQILGRFFPLLGLVLISPILLHEFDEDIASVIWTKRLAYWKVVCIRLVTALLIVAILYAVYLTILAVNGSAFLWRHVLYSFINLLFLGGLALVAMALTKSSTVGYMVAIIYYVMNFFVAKQLGAFYLSQMNEMKWLLLSLACGSIAAAIFYRCTKK
ncbi:hypothetical protein DCE79_05850 [Lysinibacillus sp. 2017]|nr:hypothetical protein DCE79_05850 [Lysinibacillus sp. 2017]